jgi:hypothetical protein
MWKRSRIFVSLCFVGLCFGGPEGIRTLDLFHAMEARSRGTTGPVKLIYRGFLQWKRLPGYALQAHPTLDKNAPTSAPAMLDNK